jgi:hypothetical protein
MDPDIALRRRHISDWASVRKVHIGQSGTTIAARGKQRQRYVRLHQPEKSAVAEHRISTVHCIHFSGTSILYGTP